MISYRLPSRLAPPVRGLRRVGAALTKGGKADFVEGAVMARVPPQQHKTPILLAGEAAPAARLAHPRVVQPVTLGATVVEHRDIFAVLAFMLVYGGTVVVLGMVMVLSGLDPVTAFSAVIASVNCMGPGLGEVGPASHFGVLGHFQVWVCSIAMVLGRLEMLSLIALLAPSFWRH